jgi:hypothetical protein
MMSTLSRLAAAAAALLLAGCLDSHTFEESLTPPAGSSIRNSKVMVYSFLDFRESSFGSDTLAAFEKQIPQRFAEVGVTARVADFRGLPAGKYFSVSNTDSQLPIERLLESGQPLENELGAQYRLLILPSYTEFPSARFRITWAIFSARGGRRLWSGQSNLHTDYIWSTDSSPDSHAKYLLDPLMAELKLKALTD